MRFNRSIPLLGASILLVGCAINPWWEAQRSGWAIFGANISVPRKAQPVPLAFLPEAARWDEPIYVEAWVESVDQENGAWMTIGDGTSTPIMVLPERGFTLPMNARGRRTMAWGRPLVASSSVESEGETIRTSSQVEFVAETILIQGFYGLQSPPPPRFREPPKPPTPEEARNAVQPPPLVILELEEPPPAPEPEPEPEPELEPAPPPPPAPIVDLPDR